MTTTPKPMSNALPPPEKIDRYEIIKELGRGGMAAVYLARDPRFGREVAIKVLPAQFTHDPQFKARFDLEAKTIAALEHEAIVPVHDFGEFESQPYLVMRSMAGGSLAERIPKGGMPLDETLPILLRIAPALDKAHQNGIIHRDLKPGNILFDSDGKAYIADFGVVKLAEATASLTMGVIGTPEYMSPEQGRAKEELDGRSDVYALGVVVYQLLTGQLPFEANTPAGLIYAHTHEPLPDIRKINRDVSKDIKAVLEKALAKDRETRYPTAKAFATALARAASTSVPKAMEMQAAAPETEVVTTSNKPMSTALPPPDPPGPIKWVRDNLLGGWLNASLTIISIVIIYFGVTGLVRWIFFTGDWRPVTQFPLLYAIGQYPREEMWRVGASLSLTVYLIGLGWGKWGRLLQPLSLGGIVFFAFFALLPVSHPALTTGMRFYLGANALLVAVGYFMGRLKGLTNWIVLTLWGIAPVVIIILFSGFENFSRLERISTTLWGGLLVTFLLAVGGILLSFPIGVALALGRRSSLPVVSLFSTFFIELIRGVPLVTILFMFSIILALFLPPEARLDRLFRALLAMTVFSAAYTAENVRGGLQSVPPGQIEAAKAVGMSGFQTMLLIVLPQAIRAVIPAIVGQFISLFKDTTLVVIVGINDFLGIGRSILNSSAEFVRLQAEVYVFIAVVYMLFSYLMSQASRRIETALGVGTR